MKHFNFEFYKESSRFVYFAGKFEKAARIAVLTDEARKLAEGDGPDSGEGEGSGDTKAKILRALKKEADEEPESESAS